jgi:hypothetical protein
MDVKKALIEGVIQDLVKFLCEETNMPIEEALEMVYNSIVFEKLSQADTGLYRESSSYVYELLKDEIADKKLIQKEI